MLEQAICASALLLSGFAQCSAALEAQETAVAASALTIVAKGPTSVLKLHWIAKLPQLVQADEATMHLFTLEYDWMLAKIKHMELMARALSNPKEMIESARREEEAKAAHDKYKADEKVKSDKALEASIVNLNKEKVGSYRNKLINRLYALKIRNPTEYMTQKIETLSAENNHLLMLFKDLRLEEQQITEQLDIIARNVIIHARSLNGEYQSYSKALAQPSALTVSSADAYAKISLAFARFMQTMEISNKTYNKYFILKLQLKVLDGQLAVVKELKSIA